MIGAEGAIGGTYGVMPELFLKMDALLKEGKIAEARAIQYDVDAVIYKMCSAHGNMYAVIKEILRRNEKLDIGDVRRPLSSLVPEDEQIVAEAAGMIRDARAKYL